MSSKKFEWLIGMLCSMYLAVPGAIAFFYYLQQALRLSNRNPDTWLFRRFHEDISFWKSLVTNMDSRPSYVAGLVQH